jgi:hypothetical protein
MELVPPPLLLEEVAAGVAVASADDTGRPTAALANTLT